MSRLSPERLTIIVGADVLEFAYAGRSATTPWSRRLEPYSDSAAGEETIRAVREELERQQVPEHTELRVVACGTWPRYCIIPWQREFSRSDARRAYVQSCFAESFGDVARGWATLASHPAYGRASLGAALDRQFLSAWQSLADERKLRLTSMTPGLVHGYARARPTIEESRFWLVQGEPGRLTLLFVDEGAPAIVSIASREEAALEVLLEREWRARGLGLAPCPVYSVELPGSQPARRSAGRWTLKVVPAAITRARLRPVDLNRGAP